MRAKPKPTEKRLPRNTHEKGYLETSYSAHLLLCSSRDRKKNYDQRDEIKKFKVD